MDSPVSSSASSLAVERIGGILRLTFNHPSRRNALTRDMLVRLREALETAERDEAVRAVVLTGAGGFFSAGQDLSERDPRTVDNWPLDLERIQAELYHPVIRLLRTMPKPVVAVVPGIAAGAAAALALATDIVLAGQSARFAFPFVNVGLSVDAGLGWVLTRSLGPARTRALLMTGGALSAEEAAAAGMIWRCVPDAALASTEQDLVQSLISAPQQALRSIKSAIARAEGDAFDAYLLHEAAQQGMAGKAPDYAEGVLAFLQRRKPNFA